LENWILFNLLGEEIVDNFDEDLSNIVLYDVDVLMENLEESSSLNSFNNDITVIIIKLYTFYILYNIYKY